jgi:hydroxyethylthiazole kinase-like uncharacterized protein yjeF
MENAARGMAEVARSMLPASGARVVVVCGAGNNGGDGYAIARHLANAGHLVELVAVRPPRAGSDAATNATICARMGLGVVALARATTVDDANPAPALLLDAIFGTGLDRPVEDPERAAMRTMNACSRRHAVPILAVDLPSGVDNDAGETWCRWPRGADPADRPDDRPADRPDDRPADDAVWATATAVTVAPRPAMRLAPADAHFGRVTIIDIGSPAALLAEFGRAML